MWWRIRTKPKPVRIFAESVCRLASQPRVNGCLSPFSRRSAEPLRLHDIDNNIVNFVNLSTKWYISRQFQTRKVLVSRTGLWSLLGNPPYTLLTNLGYIHSKVPSSFQAPRVAFTGKRKACNFYSDLVSDKSTQWPVHLIFSYSYTFSHISEAMIAPVARPRLDAGDWVWWLGEGQLFYYYFAGMYLL